MFIVESKIKRTNEANKRHWRKKNTHKENRENDNREAKNEAIKWSKECVCVCVERKNKAILKRNYGLWYFLCEFVLSIVF